MNRDHRNRELPWNPHLPAEIRPQAFGTLGREWLTRAGTADGLSMEAEHLGTATGSGGEYEIDVLVRLAGLGGAEIVVLAECKHEARPVERKEVLVLEDKLRDVGAHKGMLFSTAGFQKGAIDYATAHGIATVTVIRGEWTYKTKAAGLEPVEPPPWVQFDEYVGLSLTATEGGLASHVIEMDRPDALLQWLHSWREEVAEPAD